MTFDEKLAPDNLGAQYGVGDRLKSEREAQGLSLEDISQTLKVSRRILEQVEANAWGELPGYTFARGIVRGYAKLVSVDVQPLLEELESAPLLKRPVLELPSSTRTALPVPGQSRPRDRLAMVGGVILVAASVMAYFLVPENWFSGHPGGGLTGGAHQASVAQTRTPALMEPALAVLPNQVSGTNPESAVGVQIVAPTPVPLDVVPAQAVASDAVALTGKPSLLILFKESSWVEVKDGNGVMLLSENVSGGEERTVNGTGPISLALGNADGVSVRFRGQSVDLKAHTRQKVARLTLE